MSLVLVIGATRGLGAELIKRYANNSSTQKVSGTTRSDHGPTDFPENVKWLTGIDLTNEEAAVSIVTQLKGVNSIDTVIITAGHFSTEDFTSGKGPNWSEEVKMYTTSSIAPVFLIHKLVHANLLVAGSKIVLVSSEAGSIGLRHEKEGGGNYAHHASKAALNMVGKLLSLDLKDRGIIVSIVHPGFMRTDMTAGVGYDKYWDAGGAVTPDVAAKSLVEWINRLTLDRSGEYWAPRGPGDIGTAESVLGKNLSTPLQLPW
ncbi:hypothetical protein HK097_007405 [Rhizophlyctis rosea]|uniref:Oxidoreductase n=1 Tax=Rhizophlyctis rosea TaxID=64517 RepID=A0AAD5SJL2_9FUNG|nr:hypothetical protein HK097_007405 [Rhizophlyctis rosea]